MKRVFTLALVLLVATAGYSQVKKVSRNDAKKQVATMQRATGLETFEFVQSEPNMTRTEGDLDFTTYDWQSNDGPRTWTHVWEDGKINFAYTMATETNFSDRGTGIGTYDINNDEWIPCEGRVETEKTGFGSIARYKENGLVIAAHTATECGVYIIEDKDNIAAGCAVSLPHLNNTNEPTWPNVMTSGPDRDIIHIAVTAYSNNVPGMTEVTDPIIYFRSMDGGQTWDKQNEILPFMGPEYAIDWTSNCCYWMETTEDNCLALVVNNAWSDGMVIYSYDDGETWERKVFYKHPNPFGDFTDTWFFYPRWTSAQWDSNHKLHVVYEFNGTTGTPGSGSYYPALGGVAYWNEDMPYHGDGSSLTYGPDPNNPMPPTPGQPFLMDSAYMYNDIYASWWLWSDASHEMWPEYFGYLAALTDDGDPEPDPYNVTEFNIEDRSLHGSYNSGVCAFPVLCMLPGDDMVAIWSAMDENNVDGNGNFYYKIFASASGDGGNTWAHQQQLTKEFMYSYSEFAYNQAVVVDGQLIIASQSDSETGTYVQSDDSDPDDCYYQGLTFDINDLWPGLLDGISEVSHNTKMSNVYPNPAVDQLNVTLNQNADIVIYNIMGQAVMNVEGHVGANTISISNLSSGIYFINAGSDTQKFVVK